MTTIDERVEKIAEQVADARVSLAKHGAQIAAVCIKLDEVRKDVHDLGSKIDENFDKIVSRQLDDAQKSNSFWRSAILKILLIVLGSGAVGGATATAVQALNQPDPPAVTQPIDP